MDKLHKITFITTHNWETKRLGGFHKFAAAAAEHGIETVFFSFPRPYYGYFMRREQVNPGVIRRLSKGVRCMTPDGAQLLNVTLPTFRLPDAAGKLLPDFFMNAFLRTSFSPFPCFVRRFLAGTDCFVFESCEGIALAKKLKKYFPDARFVYRPSDPLVYGAVPERVKCLERDMLYTADMTVIVNEEGLAAYRKSVPAFDERVTYSVLSNGIDIAPYRQSYPVPELLRGGLTALYVGAWGVEWELLFRAAQKTPDITYVVVCPNYPPERIQKRAAASRNVRYVPGIDPADVPAWITNCTAVMVPYETGFYKDRPLGITAKYYQAMAAGKPIVAYHDTPKLADAGVAVTYTYDDFIREISAAVSQKKKEYQFDLENRSWETITEKFLEILYGKEGCSV